MVGNNLPHDAKETPVGPEEFCSQILDIAQSTESRRIARTSVSHTTLTVMSDETVDNVERLPLSKLHYLPCSIDYDGTAAVKSFFHVEHTKRGGDLCLKTHLRGHKLSGREIQISPSTTEKGSSDKIGDSQNCPSVVGLCVRDGGNMDWVVEGKFDSISEWVHGETFDSSQIEHHLSWFLTADQVSVRH